MVKASLLVLALALTSPTAAAQAAVLEGSRAMFAQVQKQKRMDEPAATNAARQRYQHWLRMQGYRGANPPADEKEKKAAPR